MAICWRMPTSSFDVESVWSPERYSPQRARQNAANQNGVPLASLVTLKKETFNPAGKLKSSQRYVVLDTNHAYEGRLQFRGQPVAIDEVGSIKRPLHDGLIIVSRLRTYLRQIALIDDAFIERYGAELLCSSEFYVIAPLNGEDIAFLVPFLLSPEVQKIFASAEEGGHHPRIHADVLMGLVVPTEIVKLRAELSERFRSALSRIRQGESGFAGVYEDVAALAK